MDFPQRDKVVNVFKNLDAFMLYDDLSKGKAYYKDNKIELYSGGYCLVFPVDFAGNKKAVRFWIKEISSLSDRYVKITHYLKQLDSPYFLNFEFREEAIEINNTDYPLAIMDWVDAKNLKGYINRWISEDIQRITNLRLEFLKMFQFLVEHKISHGDLHHNNILVTDNGEIKLVDYDSIYVPSLNQLDDFMDGIPAFQHPFRKSNTIANEKLDFFSVLVIYLGIYYFECYPHQWEDYKEKDKILLFSALDIIYPNESVLIKELLNDSDDTIVKLTQFLVQQLEVNSFDEIENPLDLLLSIKEIYNSDSELISNVEDSFDLSFEIENETSTGPSKVESKEDKFRNSIAQLFLGSKESLDFFFTNYKFEPEFIEEYQEFLQGHLQNNIHLKSDFKYSIEYLRENKDSVNWGKISQDEAFPFTEDFMDEFKSYLDGFSYELSFNKSFPFLDDDFILRNEHNINWEALLCNVVLNYRNYDEFINKYRDKIDFKYLCEYRDFPISNIEFQFKYKDLFDWEYLTEHDDFPIENLNYIEKFKEFIDWHLISRYFDIFSIENFIENFIENLDWGNLSSNDFFPFNNEEFIKKFEDKIYWEKLSTNENLPFKYDYFEKYKNNLDWDVLTKRIKLTETSLTRLNDYLNWTLVSEKEFDEFNIDLLSKFEKYWDWDVLSSNEYLELDYEILEKYQHKFNWQRLSNVIDSDDIDLINEFKHLFDWQILADRLEIELDENLIQCFKENLTWDEISANEAIHFTKEIIDLFYNFWNWGILSENASLELNADFIAYYEDEFVWDKLSANESLILTSEILEKYEDEWFWDILSKNEGITFTFDLLEEFEENWNWELLSANKGLPWDYQLFQDFHEKWHWPSLVNNKAVPWDSFTR